MDMFQYATEHLKIIIFLYIDKRQVDEGLVQLKGTLEVGMGCQ